MEKERLTAFRGSINSTLTVVGIDDHRANVKLILQTNQYWTTAANQSPDPTVRII